MTALPTRRGRRWRAEVVRDGAAEVSQRPEERRGATDDGTALGKEFREWVAGECRDRIMRALEESGRAS